MKVISVVLHPLLMPTYTFSLVFLFLPEMIKPLTLITLPFLFITTFVIPILSISMLKYSGSITSFRLENRSERPMPFAFVAIFYGITSYMFIYKVQVNDIVAAMLLASTFLIIMLTIITIKFKISIHSAGICGLLGFLIYFGMYFPSVQLTHIIVAVTLISGIAMMSRLHLQAHTPNEILAGGFLGLIIGFFGLYFLG